MRQITLTAFFILIVFFGAPFLALAEAGANGSSCDLNGVGSSGGMMYNGQCLSPSSYPTQSGVTGGGSVSLINPLKAGTSIESFLNSILDFVIRIGSIIVILMIVFVGYKFVVAQGKPDKIEEAKKMLLWTIIGALVLIGAKVISSGILATVQSLGG